jgi:hypothetical protein
MNCVLCATHPEQPRNAYGQPHREIHPREHAHHHQRPVTKKLHKRESNRGDNCCAPESPEDSRPDDLHIWIVVGPLDSKARSILIRTVEQTN